MTNIIDILNDIVFTLTDPNIWIRLALASILLVILIIFSLWQNTKLERKIIWSFFRGLIQIMLLGSILLLIFGINELWLLYIILLFMCFFAAYTNWRSYPYPKIFRYNFIAILTSVMTIMTFALLSSLIPNFDGIIYQPTESAGSSLGSFVIPVGSMVIFFAMRESGVALERLKSDLLKSKGEIEAALALGATPNRSIRGLLRDSFRASLVPTINRVAVLGIVTIPGLMSGMIIGGASPIEAAVYQIVVFMMLLTAAFFTSIVTNYLFTKQFFTSEDQINLEFYNIISMKKKEKKK
ncbi:MAG: iron export ABC transporter permease subunit FetB [Promethearchaeota archaeon]|nr:MAG: iron export ABC transporter permease subunit FetB [Candidatus Lokiarchaeota archaeon]